MSRKPPTREVHSSGWSANPWVCVDREAADRDQLAKIRDWARADGHHVSDGGRISTAVEKPYNAAN